MILVISHDGDEHALGVLAELERAGSPAVLVDTGQFPTRTSLLQAFKSGEWRFELAFGHRRVDLKACHVAWWRRPQPFTLEDGLSADAATFAYTECHEALAGLWAALDATWVNPPELDDRAHHKPFQLVTAAAAGWSIPRTVVTNDPDEARLLIEELTPERTIFKTFLASEHAWRETRLLRREELALLDRVRLAPLIFQEHVPATHDIRVTVLGDTIFAAAIKPSAGGYEVDYRMDLDGARFEPTELPPDVEGRIHALMKRLGLVYGAIDLRRTPDGDYVFLEINPAGEWRFVEERTSQPITVAMASLLTALDRP